jgi:signal transduction histidine kinase
MLCRLDAAFEAQKRFVANASHELRTPLAIVRTEIDVTLGDPRADRLDLREMAGVVREANERMELLIDSLLALATSGAGAIERRPTDLAMITEGALERLRGAPAGLTVDAVLDPAPVTGDAVLLERVAANLVENAARYNEPGGWVRVRTRVTDASRAELVVANSGPHIPPGAVEELFEPFRRLDGSRSRLTGGYGLGLAVVRAVAEAHGGETSAEALPDGGLAVRLALPADRGAAPVRGPAPLEPHSLPTHR